MAIAVVVVGLCSLTSLSAQTSRIDFHEEMAAVLEMRLAGWLDLLCAEDWPVLSKWALAGQPIDPAKDCYTLYADHAEDAILKNAKRTWADVELLEGVTQKGITKVELVRVRVTTRWIRPGDRTQTPHDIYLERLVQRPDLSLTANFPF